MEEIRKAGYQVMVNEDRMSVHVYNIISRTRMHYEKQLSKKTLTKKVNRMVFG